MHSIRTSLACFGMVAALGSAACSSADNTAPPGSQSGNGALVVKLTDAPFLTDSVKSVNIWVVRVEGRASAADSTQADSNLDDGSSSGWTTLATPNAAFDLLALQNGVTATLGQATLPAGTYNGFRFIIDPGKSSVTLKNGLVLTNSSSPNVAFPSAAKSGIKVVLDKPVQIVGSATTTLILDFDVNNSFVQRGNSIEKNGLLFKPVVKGAITDAATVNANVRIANATATPVSLLLAGAPIASATSLAFGTSSACSSVNAAAPTLSVVQTGSTLPLGGFSPSFTAGNSYTIVAWPNSAGVTQFTTLGTAYNRSVGQAGVQVFNATGTPYDVYVTTSGAALGTPSFAAVAAGATAGFSSLAPGSAQLRLTAPGSTTVLLDAGAQTLVSGQRSTIVIASPATGSTAPRVFIVAGC